MLLFECYDNCIKFAVYIHRSAVLYKKKSTYLMTDGKTFVIVI